MKNNWIITIVIALIVGGAAFFGGMKYQQSQTSARFGNGQFFAQGGQRGAGARGNQRFGGASVGEITSIDANSMTLKLMDGSSKIVNLSNSTTVSKTDTASKSDLKVGDRVAAIGTPNSDGSIDAQNVQLNPMFRGLGGSPRPTQ